MITGKTIAQLNLISPATDSMSIPVDSNGSTYRIQFQEITDKISSQGDNTTSIGAYSHAEGALTISYGDFSHSEGNQTVSVGQYSHSEGIVSTSVGNNSHAEGNGTTSSGDSSHSEGLATTTLGLGSHSEGLSTMSIGDGSHSEGNSTYSVGNYTHTEGYSNISGWRGYDVSSVISNIISIYSEDNDLTPLFTSGKVIMDDNLYSYSSTNYSNPYFSIYVDRDLNNSTIETLVYSGIDKSSFDIIYTDGDDLYVEVPLPTGFTCNFLDLTYNSVYVSSNAYLTFGGGKTDCCFSEPSDIPSVIGLPGIFLSINGTDGLLYDLYTGYTEGGTKFVIRFEGSYRNDQTIPANLIYNYVFSLYNPNIIDIVIESNPLTVGDSGVSDAIINTFLATFNGGSETAYRISTNTISYNFVNDINNLTNTSISNVTGNFSHSEGFNNKSLNRGSHSEGTNTLSVGQYSHSEGVNTIAIGYGSHSQGLGTISSGSYQNVMGKYNTTGNTTSLVVIGNGTGDTSRSDIVLVDTTGMTINGDLVFTGTITGLIPSTIPTLQQVTDEGNLTTNGITVSTISLTQNGTGENITVGDDIMLGDINNVNTLGMKGIQDDSQAFIQLGLSGCTIGSTSRGTFNISGVPEYLDNNDAINNGLLQVGDVYRSGDYLMIVHS